MRFSFSMHDIRNPWTGNTNMINGFYEEPENNVEHRYLDARLVLILFEKVSLFLMFLLILSKS